MSDTIRFTTTDESLGEIDFDGDGRTEARTEDRDGDVRAVRTDDDATKGHRTPGLRWMSKMRIRARAGVLLGLVGTMACGAIIVAPTASAAPCAAGAAAQYIDGVATAGQEIAGSPKRYEFGDSPYVGARYDQCLQTIKVYFGGYTGITHYNIRPGWGPQVEVAPHRKGVWTAPKAARNWPRNEVYFSVQACRRGGVLQKSSCSAWSPVVKINL